MPSEDGCEQDSEGELPGKQKGICKSLSPRMSKTPFVYWGRMSFVRKRRR